MLFKFILKIIYYWYLETFSIFVYLFVSCDLVYTLHNVT